ncbi:MAG: peptidylprolyl isomerase [Deltaproteobacteria bacterium]|nr:peptidylprolyl isomerase [Deltaproteobacteria bacterium]MBT4269267.1 peptidylprolyl isomerase [Deltaproteobacteria bacterium]MBT4639218.1 peptidylprolyl isomerase [Deltaproteobacteria bacterium]MBT6500124.1 peptidylprolyl isomerase [Deltaproteobacteria bacterium]MBT6611703.1 peptidylprolyl isomerase [Deltaproteobacteria bacterium]
MGQVVDIKATLKTDKGDIKLNLFAEKAPVTVASFVNLVLKKYYDGLNFHRVIDDFMIQGGCPNGDGRGGPGYQFEDECTSELKHEKPGVLSMANSGPGTNGSQFFITHVPTPWLDMKHTIFGEVLDDADMAVVNSIGQGDKIIAIELTDDTDALLTQQQERVEKWNQVLG